VSVGVERSGGKELGDEFEGDCDFRRDDKWGLVLVSFGDGLD
jgi:hypothetical protein